jgi:hypothetical protein
MDSRTIHDLVEHRLDNSTSILDIGYYYFTKLITELINCKYDKKLHCDIAIAVCTSASEIFYFHIEKSVLSYVGPDESAL